MLVLSWNLNRAKSESSTFDFLDEIDADIMLLQEVTKIPDKILDKYEYRFEKSAKKNGNRQHFGNAILVKGEIKAKINLKTDFDWANRELEIMKGNISAYSIKLNSGKGINVINVHSPAWKIPWERLSEKETKQLKLKNNNDIYGTEILYGALLNLDLAKDSWIVGGDFNSSETFDWMWGSKPRGNREIMDRMNSLGLNDCLRYSQGKLTPTFKNRTGGKVIHQIDHMYVNTNLISNLEYSVTPEKSLIFDEMLSDHLPIISKFQ